MASVRLPSVTAGQTLAGSGLVSDLSSMVRDATASKRPALVYFYTDAASRGKPTRQAAACDALERTVFAGRDPRLGVAA